MGGSKKPKKQTVGYRYFINMHLAVCHGTVDTIREIWFADKRAWAGNISRTGDSEVQFNISNENLFGGQDSEGGVAGGVGVGFGTQDQQMKYVNADGTYSGYPITSTGGYRPAWLMEAVGQIVGSYSGALKYPTMAVNYRGLMVVNLYAFYIGTSPYIKDISIQVERYWKGWYAEKARIGDACNAAHIIYEALTNTEWGLGYPISSIDDTSFRAAADTLYDESFGLALIWDAEQELIDFIEDVKSCIDATFYLNRRTGLWTIKLIRAGATSVLTIDPSNATLDSFQRRGLGDTYNELSVKYVDPQTEEYVSVTVHDLGNIQSQGRVVQQTKEYLGVRSANVAAKLAQRDLQAASSTLATAEVTVNRKAWGVNPGDVVTLVWPDEGIAYVEMRVVDTEQAEPSSDLIKLTLVQDVFGQANSDFSGGQDSGYTRPDNNPELFDPVLPWELPFWFVMGFFNQAASSFPAGTTYSTELVSTDNEAAKSQVLYNYQTLSNASGWVDVVEGEITPSATTTVPIPAASTSAFVIENMMRAIYIEQMTFILLTDGIPNGKEEICLVTDFHAESLTLTVARGIMDTPPRAWPAGTQIFFIDEDHIPADQTARSRGSVVQYRPAMRAPDGVMPVGDIPTDMLMLKGRFELPYPVANVIIGPEGTWWPDKVTTGETMAVAWAPRNRLAQDGATQVLWGDAPISPESGTTFGYELKNAAGTVVDSKSGITAWNTTVNVKGLPKAKYTLAIYSTRGGLRNYMDFEHTLEIEVQASGYGKNYGNSYGAV